jgi:TonB family protein
MSSRPLAVLCALLMLAATLAAQDIRTSPGPLEKAARPTTPENPVPRRRFSLPAAYPAEARAVEATARVTMRVTLDGTGRIGEIRPLMNPLVSVAPGTTPTPAMLQSVGEAMVRSAAAALSQWQYDAPAEGPISFSVTFNFRPGAETMATQESRPLGGRSGGTGLDVPPPQAEPCHAAAGAVRVGGTVRAPAQVARTLPVYPPEALAACVQGVVILEAVIGEDGRVRDLRVLRSIPALDRAAVDAVRQWEYTPTVLNGKAVPIVMTVTVNFTLNPPPPPPQ